MLKHEVERTDTRPLFGEYYGQIIFEGGAELRFDPVTSLNVKNFRALFIEYIESARLRAFATEAMLTRTENLLND